MLRHTLALTAAAFAWLNVPQAAEAQTIFVFAKLHRATSISNADGGGSDDDIYWKARIVPPIGAEEELRCSTLGKHTDGKKEIEPDWVCTAGFDLAEGVALTDDFKIIVELWEEDDGFNGADDQFDIHPTAGRKSLEFILNPASQAIRVVDAVGFDEQDCRDLPLVFGGNEGEDFAEVEVTVGAALQPDGDSDGDGLLDVWEVCDVRQLGLPGMGVDPYRKDLFVEVDWFIDDDGNPTGVGLADHSHEPWLPALITAVNEFDQAPLTNPPQADGTSTRNGIQLHVDVGTLYAGYRLDFNGDGTPEIAVPASGNLDVNADGVVDIGNLGGGNRVCGDLVPADEANPVPCPNADVVDVVEDIATTIRDNNYDSARRGVFHYAGFVHSLGNCSTTSGRAPQGGFDFAVSLRGSHAGCSGGWGREPFFVGPSGLPVDGTIHEHAGTFMHELGHRIGLGHGGVDGTNRKPNHQSVMNYDYQTRGVHFDVTGDGIADAIIGFDFDMDGQPDSRRFNYSGIDLPDLDETALNEVAGLGDGKALVIHGPGPVDTDGDGVCDVNCALALSALDTNCDGTCDVNCWMQTTCPQRRMLCPADTPSGNCLLTTVGDVPVDWSRGNTDGLNGTDDDLNVSQLVLPAGVGPVTTDLNRDGMSTVLAGSNDWALVGGRRITPDRRVDLDLGAVVELTSEVETTARADLEGLVAVPALSTVVEACAAAPTTVDFDDQPIGVLDGQAYAPELVVEGGARVAGPTERAGQPTDSGDRSLVRSAIGAPLVMRFSRPQRYVGLALGRINNADRPGQAVLRGYDVEGIHVGQVRVEVPAAAAGINQFVGFGTRYDDERIVLLEIAYEQIAEPVHVDSVTLCQTKQALAILPTGYDHVPVFGDHDVTVSVRAVSLLAAADSATAIYEELPIGEADFFLDGVPETTDYDYIVKEGTKVILQATKVLAPGKIQFAFDHWRLEPGVQFPADRDKISLAANESVTITAVYVLQTDKGTLPKSCNCDSTSTSGPAGAALLGLLALFGLIRLRRWRPFSGRRA